MKHSTQEPKPLSIGRLSISTLFRTIDMPAWGNNVKRWRVYQDCNNIIIVNNKRFVNPTKYWS